MCTGKTTVAAAIAERIGPDHLLHVSHDSYYKTVPGTLEQRAQTNFDHPDALDTPLLIQHLHQLKEGREVSSSPDQSSFAAVRIACLCLLAHSDNRCGQVDVPTYDFNTHSRMDVVTHAKPARIVLVEGEADHGLYTLADSTRLDARTRAIVTHSGIRCCEVGP